MSTRSLSRTASLNAAGRSARPNWNHLYLVLNADIEPSVGGGSIQLDGRSRLRSASAWVAADVRMVAIDRQRSLTGGVRCAGVDVQPTLTITRPAGGGSNYTFQNSINDGCGTPAVAACGTAQASGSKTITAVSYELRRQALFYGTQCWNGSGYSQNYCGAWRAATVSGTNPVTWRVPGSDAYGAPLLFGASFTLTVRATDSSGQTIVQIFEFNVS